MYARKIKSLQRQIDESRMGNDESSDGEANLLESSHIHSEEDELETKHNKNSVRQGSPRKINKNKKIEDEMPGLKNCLWKL